jgi:hypothetical protein
MMDAPAAATGKLDNPVATALSKTIMTSLSSTGSSNLANALAASLGEPPSKVTSTAAPANGPAADAPAGTIADKLKAATANAGNPSTSTAGNSTAPAASESAAPASAELKLVAEKSELKVGEKQRLALVLTNTTALGPLAIRLKFDPKIIAVRGLSQGAQAGGVAPTVMQSIDPAGALMLSVSPQNGAPLRAGSTVLLFLDIEAVGAGDAAVTFERENVHFVGAMGGEVTGRFSELRLSIKQ